MRRRVKDRKSSILSCKFLRCCAQMLKLIVQDGLKDLSESISKVRNAVRYVKSSLVRFETFKTCVWLEGISSKNVLS